MSQTENERLAVYVAEVAPHMPADVRAWLEGIGFFTAPASTKYHGAWEGGLFDHSLCVMRQLVLLTDRNGLRWDRPESPYIVGFLHDVCKADQYLPNPARRDERDPAYIYNRKQALSGHGDKSVMLIQRHFPLTFQEMVCIRYHMGAFTDRDQWNDYTNAVAACENVLWTHTADMLASHVYDR